MYSVMAGADPRDYTSLPGKPSPTIESGGVSGLRIAFSPDLDHARVDPGVAAAVRQAADRLSDLGAQVDHVTPAWGPRGRDLERMVWGLAMLPYLPETDEQASLMDPGLVACARDFEHVTAREATAVYGQRIDYAVAVNSWFSNQGYDLLVTPAASVTAFPVGRQMPEHWEQHPWDWMNWAEFSYPFNLSHGPAVSIPVGLDEGLPVGMQIAGPRLSDDLVLRAAATYLAAFPFDMTPAMRSTA
jgi:aspartyl-tRNA(Asn)/glutamyl-tRNA(Gln) amidotransferase subunit A